MPLLVILGLFPLALATKFNYSGCCDYPHPPNSPPGMTVDICNALLMGVYPYFMVSNLACIGAISPYPTNPIAACPNNTGSFFNTMALYSAVAEPQAPGEYNTGFFGAGLNSTARNQSWGSIPNQFPKALYFNVTGGRLVDIEVYYNNSLPLSRNFINPYVFAPDECITNFSLSFAIGLPDFLGINGYEFKTTLNQSGISWGNFTNVVSALRLGGNYCLRGLIPVPSWNFSLSFNWVLRPSPSPANTPSPNDNLIAGDCLSDKTAERLQKSGNSDLIGKNATCKEQLTVVLKNNQKNFSWVLLGLMGAALAVNVALFTTSKLHWHDDEAEYITVLTATMGVVEYASEVMMIQSLSFDEEFALEFYVCLAALLASSVINVLGNVVILMLYGHFKPWLAAQRLHRVAFAVFAALCFLKGNILAVLASRLDHANTRLFQLPWSRRLQLRFRVLGLFVLCFSSLPQLVVIVLLHERLDEWTPLNALFVAVSICGCTIVAWRAFFELTFKDRGLDKDRNLEDNNKGDNDINDLPEPLRMQ